jgi:hypothetical protein
MGDVVRFGYAEIPDALYVIAAIRQSAYPQMTRFCMVGADS